MRKKHNSKYNTLKPKGKLGFKDENNKIDFELTRAHILLAIFALVGLFLLLRLFFLQLNTDFLKGQGDARAIRKVSIEAQRGIIFDRNNEPLAVSAPVYSIWANTRMFDLQLVIAENKLQSLLSYLDITEQELTDKTNNKNKNFVYLVRHIEPGLKDKILSLEIPGLFEQKEYRRFYPTGEITSHILGFTNLDDKGQEGLELTLETWLQAQHGEKIVLKDRIGRSIADIEESVAAKSGNDVTLSIDNRIQYLAYRELKRAVSKYAAKGGSVVVMDVNSFEVLALVNQPSFNPNIRQKKIDDSYMNRAVGYSFEPGSVLKAFSMLAILDSKQFALDAEVDTSPGWFKIGGNIVKDIHNNGKIRLYDILKKSSNVGIAKLLLQLDDNTLYEVLHRFGFGEQVIDYLPENVGVLRNYSSWDPFVLATMSFGYAMTANALQLARAYAILAAGGISYPVSILKRSEEEIIAMRSAGKRVADSLSVQQLNTLLTRVGELGVGGRARVHGYKVAGKTGTSKKVGERGYENRYISTFAGFAPAEKPRLVVVVVIDEPSKTNYYGSVICAPVFAKVMQDSLRILEAPI